MANIMITKSMTIEILQGAKDLTLLGIRELGSRQSEFLPSLQED